MNILFSIAPIALAALPVLAGLDATQLVAAARSQVGVTVGYDPAYRKLAYPGGDVPIETGVCCDVVIRALRQQNVDLQQRVHEDMTDHFSRYPANWGLKAPDSNIDHRRVPNLACYFRRQGWALAVSTNAVEYQPGDVVTWDLGGGVAHIGVVSDNHNRQGVPLMIHNIGRGAREEDILFRFVITGHFRLAAGTGSSTPRPASVPAGVPRTVDAGAGAGQKELAGGVEGGGLRMGRPVFGCNTLFPGGRLTDPLTQFTMAAHITSVHAQLHGMAPADAIRCMGGCGR